MLAALFVQGGINALRAPEVHAQISKPVLDAVAPMIDRLTGRRPDDELLIKIDAGVKIAAGSMLALGTLPRLASVALAATLVPTTLAGHRFWEESDPQRKQEEQIHFLKNVGMLGGLLIAAADTEGKPSLAWQSRKAAKRAATVTASQAGAISGAVHDVRGRVSGTAHQAASTVAGLPARLTPTTGIASRSSRARSGVSSRASGISTGLSRRAERARRKAQKQGITLQRSAEKARRTTQRRGATLQKTAEMRAAQLQVAAAKGLEKTAPLRAQAGLLGHDLAVRASAVGSEVAHQAEGLAKDVRKRAHAATH